MRRLISAGCVCRMSSVSCRVVSWIHWDGQMGVCESEAKFGGNEVVGCRSILIIEVSGALWLDGKGDATFVRIGLQSVVQLPAGGFASNGVGFCYIGLFASTVRVR